MEIIFKCFYVKLKNCLVFTYHIHKCGLTFANISVNLNGNCHLRLSILSIHHWSCQMTKQMAEFKVSYSIMITSI